MNHNPEIEKILEQAVQIAKEKQHEYVMTEHLLLALLRFEPFTKVVIGFGTPIDIFMMELEGYLTALVSNVSKDSDVQPKKTNSLERVFNRAHTQMLFNNRKTINTLDLFVGIHGETNSHAHYFLLKYGLRKEEFLEFWQKNYRQGDIKLDHQQANEILEEHCINLTRMASEDRLEPLIGRSSELDEMITILARRFKANVLMVGDPGVGKTAIIEGLAQEVNKGNVPEFLKGFEVWSL